MCALGKYLAPFLPSVIHFSKPFTVLFPECHHNCIPVCYWLGDRKTTDWSYFAVSLIMLLIELIYYIKNALSVVLRLLLCVCEKGNLVIEKYLVIWLTLYLVISMCCYWQGISSLPQTAGPQRSNSETSDVR